MSEHMTTAEIRAFARDYAAGGFTAGAEVLLKLADSHDHLEARVKELEEALHGIVDAYSEWRKFRALSGADPYGFRIMNAHEKKIHDARAVLEKKS